MDGFAQLIVVGSIIAAALALIGTLSAIALTRLSETQPDPEIRMRALADEQLRLISRAMMINDSTEIQTEEIKRSIDAHMQRVESELTRLEREYAKAARNSDAA